MKTSSARFSHAIAVLFSAILLSSCNGSGAASSTPLTLQPALRTLTSLSAVPLQAVHPDLRKSWVSPDIKRASELAFVSDDAYNDVFVFSLPDLKLEATLSGFSEPQGMCTAPNGNVWIANTGTEQILEYASAGEEIASLNDSVGYPVGCAVDSKNDLAVTDIFGFNGAGQVLFYKNSTGAPTELLNLSQYYYYFDTFDPKGNLYVDGKTSAGSYILSKCASRSTVCSTITVSGVSGTFFPGFVQWYKPGNYLAVGSTCGTTKMACIDWVRIKGLKGRIIGATHLLNYNGGQVCDLTQAAIDPIRGKYVVGGDYEYCGSASTSVDRWVYPAGGEPTSYDTSGLGEPIGVAISVK